MMSKAAQAGNIKKKCVTCGRTKSASSFAINKKEPDLLMKRCKPCERLASIERKRRLDAFRGENPVGEIVPFNRAKLELGVSSNKLTEMIERHEVKAVNLGTMKHNAWRVLLPVKEEPVEPAAEPVADEQPPAVDTAGVVRRMDRLEGMADVIAMTHPEYANFTAELSALFNTMR